MNENSKKYKINMYLLSLPVADYRRAMRIIPRVLGISVNTFHNYRNIGLTAKQDIPYAIVIQFELLFELEPGSLFNGELRQLPLKSLLKKESSPRVTKKNRGKNLI